MLIARRMGAGLAMAAIALVGATPAPAQLSAVEKLYEDLARLPDAERQKRLEEGARREGKVSIVHTLRGELGSNHLEIFRKRYPFIKVDLNVDIGSQDAAERLVAEETTRRHLTDVITIALPDGVEPVRRNFVARDRKSTRLNSSHVALSRMPSSA